jgi:hypothetical protein
LQPDGLFGLPLYLIARFAGRAEWLGASLRERPPSGRYRNNDDVASSGLDVFGLGAPCPQGLKALA